VRHIIGSFSFLFATKGVGKTVRYNDTRDANKRATYCIIHELLLIKALRLMSAVNDSLFIFFCGVSPPHLIPYSPRFEPRLPPPYCSRVGTGQQKDKALFRYLPQQTLRDK
jgi:hypothetical protein